MLHDLKCARNDMHAAVLCHSWHWLMRTHIYAFGCALVLMTGQLMFCCMLKSQIAVCLSQLLCMRHKSALQLSR